MKPLLAVPVILVACVVVAAVVTPPDPWSCMVICIYIAIVALPSYFLGFASGRPGSSEVAGTQSDLANAGQPPSPPAAGHAARDG
jgi:hypothetical protein